MLSIENLSFQYASAARPALDGISLSVARGEILGLLGPNGAGKTTLISHLAGRLAIQRGAISMDGTALDALRRTAPTRITLAPQDYAFYPMLSVRENLKVFAAASRLSGARLRERCEACMAFAQLERFAQTRGEQLSGGLKRRLNLAIALLPEPDLILLDEPTVGVDPQSRAFILDAVHSLARAGAAVIYTSHYMDEIEAIADRIAIIDHGRLLRDATLSQLLAEGARSLRVSADGVAPHALATLLAPWGMTTVDGNTVTLALNDNANPVEALATIVAHGGTLTRAHYGHDNLEQLFMRLTKRSLRD